jgi:hypothetical protein
MKTLLLLILFSTTLQAQRTITDGYFALIKGGEILKDSCTTNGRPIYIDGNFEEVGGLVITGATWSEFMYNMDAYRGIVRDSIYSIKFSYEGRNFTVGVLNVDYFRKEASLAVWELREDGWYKAILIADNTKLIDGKGDFDHIWDLSENKKVKNSDIIKAIIARRVADESIDTKMQKIK